ncbi:MAG: hypothetical protein J6T33_08410, partial [Bacteroidales bacterium]|nr:hypothetical protein [Bacteroidales bacterium]
NEVKSDYGHDAFLLENGQMNFLLGNFLSENAVKDLMRSVVPTITIDYSYRAAAPFSASHSIGIALNL